MNYQKKVAIYLKLCVYNEQEVRLGAQESTLSASVDLEENSTSVISGSPPSHSQLGPLGSPAGAVISQQISVIPTDKKGERVTPPSSPNINSMYVGPPRYVDWPSFILCHSVIVLWL